MRLSVSFEPPRRPTVGHSCVSAEKSKHCRTKMMFLKPPEVTQ